MKHKRDPPAILGALPCRGHSSYAWVFQDTFAVFVCCQFVQALRMNSIKVLPHLFGLPLSFLLAKTMLTLRLYIVE